MKTYYYSLLFICIGLSAPILAQSDLPDEPQDVNFRDETYGESTQIVNLVFPGKRRSIAQNLGFNLRTTGTNFEISIESTINGSAYWLLHDLNGRYLKKGKVTFSEGQHTFEIQRQNLPMGIYILQLRIRDQLFTKKLFL